MQKNDIKIGLQNFNKICRFCLGENDELECVYEIFVENASKTEQIDLVGIFKRHCDVEISPYDEKPQGVCKPCRTQLCESYAFFDKCLQSNYILDNILSEKKHFDDFETTEIDPNKNDSKPVRKPKKKLYCTESEDDTAIEDCDEDSDWEPSFEETKNDLSVKLEDVLDVLEQQNEDSCNKFQERKLKVTRKRKRLRPLKRRGRKKKITSEPKDDPEDCRAIENQHKDLVCRLCNETLPNINTSIDHYDEVHVPEMEVDECIFCEKPKTYKKRDNLLYHMALHSKESIKCVPCRKYFRTKEALMEHLDECFQVDKKIVVKLEESMENNYCSSSNNKSTQQLSQKELQETQYDGAFSCRLCNRQLGEIDAVISHYEETHTNDLSCIICLRAFTKQVPLFHMGLHSEKTFLCRPCRLFFRKKEAYDTHIEKYDHDKSLACKICGKKFTRNYKKNKHMLSHLKEKNYSCNKCGKTFTYKTSLVRHFKMHFGKRFLCSSCGNAYTTKFMLQRHIRRMHTNVDEDGNPLPKPPAEPLNIQCEYCGEIFVTKYSYGRHIRRHPEFKEFKCKICSFICDTREQLEGHMENRHNKHTCDVCGKRFPFKSELQTHHRKHEDMESAKFRCDVCGKTARTQTQLKVHYRIHTGERPFSCEACGKSFKQSAHLKVHMFQHTGKMPFKCKICEKSFPFQHVMEIHLRTHTGEKPFKCACGNMYHDRTTLQKHQRAKHPDMPVERAARREYKVSTLPNV